jgi:hypothetical protein
MPFILLLTFLGGFAEKNAFQDIVVVLVFGGLGWVLVKLGWQRPPLLLGLVLGPLMENRLFLSTDNYGVAWLWRPGVIILFIIILAGIFYPTVKERLQRKAGEVEKAAAPGQDSASRSKPSVVFAFFIVLAVAWALWTGRDFGYRAGLFPWAIGYPLFALAVAQLILELLGKGGTKSYEETLVGVDLPRNVVVQRTTGIICWILGFFAAIWLLGFIWAVPITTLLYLKFAGNEKWPITLAITIGASAFFYGVFEYALRIPFPEGQVFEWLK